MTNSRIQYDYLKRRLKKQKRRTFLMFLVGLILASVATFNIYYWYPLLKKELNLPKIPQISMPNTKKVEKKITTVKKDVYEETDINNTFTPRVAFNQPIKASGQYKELTEQINQMIQQSHASGTFLVVKNNQALLYENYGVAKDIHTDAITSTYMIASVQKAITASLIMKLVEENKLTLDSHLSEFYPEIPNSQEITIDSMLAMTSGLTLKEKLKETKTKEEAVKHALAHTQYEPTQSWKYTDINYFLLAMIVEKLSQTTYEDYFKQVIQTPLNLEHSGFYDNLSKESPLIPSFAMDDLGNIDSQKPVNIPTSVYINELGTGNMYMSSGDLLTFVQSLLDGDIVSYPNVKNMWQRRPANYPYTYKAGFYYKDAHFSGHGIFRGYEPTIMFNNDASDAVVFLSNTYTKDKTNQQLVDAIYNQIIQPTIILEN